jgi:hypothetical protein
VSVLPVLWRALRIGGDRVGSAAALLIAPSTLYASILGAVVATP